MKIAPATTEPETPPMPRGRSTIWQLPADLGRRYARASGDYNPIHLWPLTAKLFGFRRAIIHGMWSISRAVAELDDDLPAFPVQIAAELKRPILLPGRVLFAAGDGELAIRSVDRQTLHLTGRCLPIRTPAPRAP